MFKKFKSKVRGVCSRAKSAVRHVKAGALALFLAVASPVVTFAQNAAGDYSAGTSALAKVTEENAFWLNHTQIKYDKMNIRLKKTRYK